MKKNVWLYLVIFFFLAIPVFAEGMESEKSDMGQSDMTEYKDEDLGEGVVVGTIDSIDLESATLTVRAEDGKVLAFSVVQDETILWKGVEDIQLQALNKDEKVEVGYYKDNGDKLIASWVDVLMDTATIETEKILGNETVKPQEEGEPAEEIDE